MGEEGVVEGDGGVDKFGARGGSEEEGSRKSMGGRWKGEGGVEEGSCALGNGARA